MGPIPPVGPDQWLAGEGSGSMCFPRWIGREGRSAHVDKSVVQAGHRLAARGMPA